MDDLVAHAKTLRSSLKIGEEGVVGGYPSKKIYLTEEFTLSKGEVMPRRAGISFRARGISRVIEALKKQKVVRGRKWGFRGLGLKRLDLERRAGIGLKEFIKKSKTPKTPRVETPKLKEVEVKGISKAVAGEIGYEVGLANLRALESMMARNIAFLSAFSHVPRIPSPRITIPRLELKQIGTFRLESLKDFEKLAKPQIPVPKAESLGLEKIISMPRFRFEFPKITPSEPKVSEVKPIISEITTPSLGEIPTPIPVAPPPPEIIIPPGIPGFPAGELPSGFGKTRFRYPKWWYYQLRIHPLAPLQKVVKKMAKGMGVK